MTIVTVSTVFAVLVSGGVSTTVAMVVFGVQQLLVLLVAG